MTTISIIHFDMFFPIFQKNVIVPQKSNHRLFLFLQENVIFLREVYIIFIQTIFVLITFLFRFDNYFNFIVIISTNWTNIFSSIFPSIFTMFCKSNKILPILFIKKMKNHFFVFWKASKRYSPFIVQIRSFHSIFSSLRTLFSFKNKGWCFCCSVSTTQSLSKSTTKFRRKINDSCRYLPW